MTVIRRFLSTALAASLIAVAPAAQDGKLNIATVDMQELFKQYYRTIEAKKQNNVDFARIHAPIGLDIGAISPAEIAVSIMGEIVQSLRQKPARSAKAEAA